MIVGGDLDDKCAHEIQPASNFGEVDKVCRPGWNGERDETVPGHVSANEIANK